MQKLNNALGVVISVIAAMSLLVGAPAHAQSEDVFVVPRVPVKAQATSAGEAKRIAQNQGRRRAMDILLRRLTVEDDWIYLPNLRQDAAAAAAMPGPDGKTPIALSNAELLELESGFVVYGEKSSAKTYRALITYRFKPDQVRRMLRFSRIPYSESQTRTALILPILQTDSSVYLWEESNPWMAAWKARPFTHELTPMAAPLGDLEDIARIDADAALSLNQERLRALATHYSVSQIILAHARLRQENGVDQMSVRLVNAYRETSGVDQQTEFNVDGLGETASGPASTQTAFGGDAGDVLGEAFSTEPSGNFPALAERSIELAMASYAKDWKARTLVDYASEGVLEGTAFFQSIGEWTTIRAALVETPLVGSVQVSALSRNGAEMRLRVFGDPSRLATALDSKGLVLWSEDGTRWFVASAQTANLYRGQRFLRERRGLFGENANGDASPLPASADGSTDDGYRAKIDN